MKLRLEGHFSYIDKYNKLKFSFSDNINDDTKAKLIQHCGENNRPFDYEGFTVSLSKGMKMSPVAYDDIRGLIGLECVVYVQRTHYCFTSRLKRNFGEQVQGFTLVLVDIKRKD